MNRKGIILAGGTGSRLFPSTIAVSKHLLPIYNKPMIYYPISVLMLAGIKEIAVICSPNDLDAYKRLLGDGKSFGLEFSYIIQKSPDGLAQAYILSDEFLDGRPSALILGDNIFYGAGLIKMLSNANSKDKGGTIFGYQVNDPSNFGIIELDGKKPLSIEEKPKNPKSNIAVTGLYFLDSNASKFALEINPSERGELEITSLLDIYLKKQQLSIEIMGRGFAWLDTGTYDNFLESSNFVKHIENRQGFNIANIEEIAFNKGWITEDDLLKSAMKMSKTDYGKYLMKVLKK